MSHISAEIAFQPEAWRRAADLVPQVVADLPQHGERVAVVGCGTSWFMAEAYAGLRESLGHGETDAFTATEFPHHRRYDRIVAITRSGTTTEILDLLREQRGRTTTVVITADTDTPVVTASENIIDLRFADERSVVQTLFATTALTLLRAHLGHDVGALAEAAERALLVPLPRLWLEAEQITFLGSGWTHGIAREAALKLREASQSWTESYPGAEYRHGPISIAAPGRVVWHFGSGGESLVDQVRATGAAFVDHADDAQVDLVLVQRLAAERAVHLGLDPDRPRNLTRSVVLDG
ncbi:SIS domain-containing protein [Umezawaea sp. Da 62-37]|uniref:SIS domain-containing protein n=1 Tax=Umezawaea sp. Da 62-37 TaxID=3075927 RepID=UPI0028F7024D|nr:SIS domain-containing protein [Umezawaea sp. Da 62-37]WNV87552.1 SIS domain-containing protein [Umezawaea sp. Da 62-37]